MSWHIAYKGKFISKYVLFLVPLALVMRVNVHKRVGWVFPKIGVCPGKQRYFTWMMYQTEDLQEHMSMWKAVVTSVVSVGKEVSRVAHFFFSVCLFVCLSICLSACTYVPCSFASCFSGRYTPSVFPYAFLTSCLWRRVCFFPVSCC